LRCRESVADLRLNRESSLGDTEDNLWQQRLRDAGLPLSWPGENIALNALATPIKNDLGELQEARVTINNFAKTLGASFDTIETLYAIGGEMNDVANPPRFFSFVVSHLFEVMKFRSLVLRFANDSTCPEAFRGFARREGTIGEQDDDFAQAMTICRHAHQRSCIIRNDDESGGQVAMQPIILKGAIVGLLIASGKYGDDPMVNSYDTQLFEAAAGFIGSFCANVALYDDQRKMFLGTIRSLTAAIDAKDRYTCGHSERVAFLAGELTLRLGFNHDDVELVKLAGIVHDVGKIGVPEAVLTKNGRLTDEEFGLIRQHPEIGHRILSGIPPLAPVLPAVLHHHERYDGRGYPHGLAGEEIPVFARIIAIADTFDAMSSNRAYRAAMAREQVLNELSRSAGTQLDPHMVSEFVRMDFSGYDALIRANAEGQLAMSITP